MGQWKAELKQTLSGRWVGSCRFHLLTTGKLQLSRGVVRVAVLLQTLCASPVVAAPTQVVSYHGVLLEVQERTQVGPDTLQISVEGETFVVAESEAGRGVAIRLLASPSESLTAPLVTSLAARAAQVPDGEVLGAALRVIFQRDDWADFNSPRAWQDIAASEVGRARIVSALDKAVEHKITTRVCSSLQALYEFPPTLQAQALAGKAASECRDVGAQQVLRTVFLGHDIARIAREVERLSLVFEADAVSGTGLLREIETATTTLGHASAQGDARLFEETLASLKQFGERVGLSGGDLDPSVLRERFVVQAAERGAFRSIFAIVPSIRLDKRTPAVHAAVLRALDSVPADNVAGLVTVDTQAALQIFAQKDDEIDLRNQEMVRRGIRYCLAHGQSDDAFRLLRGVRSASGILPDKLVPLVSDVVEKFLDQSQRGRAEEVVTVFNQRLGVFAQLKFILARFGLAFISAVSVLLILISCGFIWYIRRCTRQAAKSLLGAETSSVPKASPPSKELVRALASFGLEPGATLSEIKNAYRVRVKECHPDRNPDAASRDNDEFVRLTTEYDRLLMLYHRERTADK